MQSTLLSETLQIQDLSSRKSETPEKGVFFFVPLAAVDAGHSFCIIIVGSYGSMGDSGSL